MECENSTINLIFRAMAPPDWYCTGGEGILLPSEPTAHTREPRRVSWRESCKLVRNLSLQKQTYFCHHHLQLWPEWGL